MSHFVCGHALQIKAYLKKKKIPRCEMIKVSNLVIWKSENVGWSHAVLRTLFFFLKSYRLLNLLRILDSNKKWGLLERVILFDITCISVHSFPLCLMWMSRLASINSFNLWFHKKACFLFIFFQAECNLCFLALPTIPVFQNSYQNACEAW